MSEEITKKKSVLQKEITFGGKGSYPSKTYINLVTNEAEAKNRKAVLWFIVFLIALGLFVRFVVIGRLHQVEVAEQQYNAMARQLSALQEANKEYDDVKKQYDEVTDWYMTDEEKSETDKNNVFDMIDEDIMAHVEVQYVSISGRTVTVETGVTTLDNVSEILGILQKDDRNGYVTVTTAAASSEDENNNDVTATIIITYGADTSAAAVSGQEGGAD